VTRRSRSIVLSFLGACQDARSRAFSPSRRKERERATEKQKEGEESREREREREKERERKKGKEREKEKQREKTATMISVALLKLAIRSSDIFKREYQRAPILSLFPVSSSRYVTRVNIYADHNRMIHNKNRLKPRPSLFVFLSNANSTTIIHSLHPLSANYSSFMTP